MKSQTFIFTKDHQKKKEEITSVLGNDRSIQSVK